MTGSSERPDSGLLFVYGTLQRGGQYHQLLEQCRARFLGSGRLLTAYPLVLAQYPCLLDQPGRGHRVHGEVYHIPSSHGWLLVDRLEGHPVEYRRRPEAVEIGGRILDAWTYFYIRADLPIRQLTFVEGFQPGGES